ncbi:MAG TPA: sigma-70 family RNA polymerase sigma factor [Acidimicrobiales bacterium]
MHLTDDTLVAGVAAGDPEAAAALVRRYQARVYGLAVTVVGDRAAAEDVAQEVFLRVWRHAAAFDARRGSVESWLLTIARNLAIDVVRVRRSSPVDPAVAQRLAASLLDGREGGALDATAAVAGSDAVRGALAALPDGQRRAVVLAVFAGCTAAEIADQEAVPLGTAKSRVRLGFAKLRTTFGVGDDRR